MNPSGLSVVALLVAGGLLYWLVCFLLAWARERILDLANKEARRVLESTQRRVDDLDSKVRDLLQDVHDLEERANASN